MKVQGALGSDMGTDLPYSHALLALYDGHHAVSGLAFHVSRW